MVFKFGLNLRVEYKSFVTLMQSQLLGLDGDNMILFCQESIKSSIFKRGRGHEFNT